MILRLAAKNNMLVFSEQEKITISSPKLGNSAVLELSYGDSILDMDVQEDTDHQYLISRPLSRNIEQRKKSITKQEATDSVSGKLSGGRDLKNAGKELSDSLKNTVFTKNVKINERDMAQLTGRICIHGSAKIKLGDMISLKGLGNKYSGKAFLRGIEHRIEAGTWISYLSIGMPEHWQEIPKKESTSQNPDRLQRARVLKLENDPEGAYRIKVQLSGMEKNEGLWAKISQFSASNNSGAFFLPEIGDEVVIGFEEGSEVSPIVLGMLYNQQHSPPLAYTD